LEHLISMAVVRMGSELSKIFSKLRRRYEPATDLLSTEFVFFGSAEKIFLEKSLALAGERIFNFPANNTCSKRKRHYQRRISQDNPWQFAVNNDLRECKFYFRHDAGTLLFPNRGCRKSLTISQERIFAPFIGSIMFRPMFQF